LKRNPESWEGHKLSGDLSMLDAAKDFRARNAVDAKKDLGLGISEYRKALSKVPGNPVITLALGRTLVLDGEVDEAENLFKGIIQKDQKNFAAYDELYRIYAAQRKLPEAENILKTAV
jgi:predicted Zn-dependent protease